MRSQKGGQKKLKAGGLAMAKSGLCLILVALTACGGGGGADVFSGYGEKSYAGFPVGTITSDPNLPAEPQLPSDTQVCATLEASKNLASRPDGALVPEADPVPALSFNGVGANRVEQTSTWPAEQGAQGAIYASAVPKINPDQARIQAALDACGTSVWAEVGSTITAADGAAAALQAAAAGLTSPPTAANFNIGGASAEELKKAAYKPAKFAVRLVVNGSGVGNAFISGPLNLPSGVTLWIDKGVTLYGSRDISLYSGVRTNGYCGNVSSPDTKTTNPPVLAQGSSSNCWALITATNTINSAVVGDGVIDARGYAELLTSKKYYPMLKADGTCTNTYAAYKRWVANNSIAATPGPTAAADVDGTPCDNGGTFVNSQSTAHNMSWWDLAWLGNMVNSGLTSAAAQSNARLIVVNYAKNFTLYRVTLTNSPNFHVVPSGVDGLIVWGVKVMTPSTAAFVSPIGNGNPLYTGENWNADNVKNTDAFDPGSSSSPAYGGVTKANGATTYSSASTTLGVYTSAPTVSTEKLFFDGFLKNFYFAYNYVSTGDDDVALKGSNNPTTKGVDGTFAIPAIDGKRGVFSKLTDGIVIAHNFFYWGHGVSIGSETNAGVTNVKVYDNSFNGGEEGIRIKSDWARGGEVSNISYTNLCMKNMQNALLFTPYYSSKAISNSTLAGVPFVPNIHDISITNVSISGGTDVILRGFQATTAYTSASPTVIAQRPLTMTLSNVATDAMDKTNLFMSDANFTLSGLVNLPIVPDSANRVSVSGNATPTTKGISSIVDCSQAFVDFPSSLSPFGKGWVN